MLNGLSHHFLELNYTHIFSVMPKLAKFLCLSNPLELCSDHFSHQLCWPGGINKDNTIWQDGARRLPKYIFRNKISLSN